MTASKPNGTNPQMTSTDASKRPFSRTAVIIALVVIAILGSVFLKDHLSFQSLSENREWLIALRDQYFISAAIGFFLVYVTMVAFSLPGATIATLTGGFLFGIFFGTALNVLSATTGATLIFLAARFGFGERFSARLGAETGAVQRIKQGLDENQWSMLFFIRLVPAVPFFLANLIPAFLNVPLRRFFISTLFGIVPGTLVLTSVGAGLSEVFETGRQPDLGIIFEPYILLPLLGLSALSLLPVFLKIKQSKKGK